METAGKPEPFFWNGPRSELCVLVPPALSEGLVALARLRGLSCDAESDVTAGSSEALPREDMVRFFQPVFLHEVDALLDEFFRMIGMGAGSDLEG